MHDSEERHATSYIHHHRRGPAAGHIVQCAGIRARTGKSIYSGSGEVGLLPANRLYYLAAMPIVRDQRPTGRR